MAQRKRRVLLVDDEPGILKTVGKGLEVAGYEVLTAPDGKDGLVKARLGRPDVIVLDLMMPVMGGLEVCAALKQDPTLSRIPVIIFTGKGQDMDERLCREIGANAYLTKPHTSAALVEQIEALLAMVPPAEPGPAQADPA
jgi:two-component system alkaline phosphatase synthesis response regulator PhoP